MKKWTTSGSSVSLRSVLAIRYLNEIECWALIGQTTQAIQFNILSLNGRLRSSASLAVASKKRSLVVSPDRLLCSISGKVTVNQLVSIDHSYVHPRLSNKRDLTEQDLESIGLYSLGQTLKDCIPADKRSDGLTELISDLTSDRVRLSCVLERVARHWRAAVGTSPIARFVAQLCKLTLGWSTTCSTPSIHIQETKEVEFSRLEDSSSSSDDCEQPKVKPCPPAGQECEPDLLQGKYGRRLDYKPSIYATSTSDTVELKSRLTAGGRKVQRNPSRLYRIVKPLADVSLNPSPATKRCVGPEFVVVSEKPPLVLDLSTPHTRKDNVVRLVTVEMLNGRKILVHCSPASITAGEILDNVLREEDIKESSLFALALLKQSEFLPLSPDTKISKVAPMGWKDHRQQSNGFTLYQRFRFLPADMDAFRDPNNKHQFYLQLRRDILSGRTHLDYNRCLALGAMALQVEFGDFLDELHGGQEYFVLEHYLPTHAVNHLGEANARQSLESLHRAHLGQSQSKTEVKFCREVQKLDNYGFQAFSVTEKRSQIERHLGIHLQGIFLFETAHDKSKQHRVVASFYWSKINRIQYDKSRFQLCIQEGTESTKLKYIVPEIKARLMFDLASAHHKHYNQQRLRSQHADDICKDTAIRSLKNRLLAKRQTSQKKLYTKAGESTRAAGMKRSTTVANTKYAVKRLTHYASMANAKEEEMLDISNKENQTPNQNYRYKVYLEPDEDDHVPPVAPLEQRLPLQERPLTTPVTRIRTGTLPSTGHRRRSESLVRTSLARPNRTAARKPARRSIGACAASTNPVRMGTRISLSALHRERLRLNTDFLPPAPKKLNLDLDFDMMETKALPRAVQPKAVIVDSEDRTLTDPDESLSDSLIERFGSMEAEDSEPERQIVSVTITKHEDGRLGLKITGTPSGIYIEDFESAKISGHLCRGDRLVAINGRSLENVSYEGALELIRRSNHSVQFLVSQIKSC